MKNKKSKQVEVETKVIEQPEVEVATETVSEQVESPKKKHKPRRKSKNKIREIDVIEVVEETPELQECEVEYIEPQVEPVACSKPTFKDWIKAIKYGIKTTPGFFNKIKWIIQLFKLNK